MIAEPYDRIDVGDRPSGRRQTAGRRAERQCERRLVADPDLATAQRSLDCGLARLASPGDLRELEDDLPGLDPDAPDPGAVHHAVRGGRLEIARRSGGRTNGVRALPSASERSSRDQIFRKRITA